MAPGVALAAALAGEAMWVMRRPLPTMTGIDASGWIAAPHSTARPLRVVALGDSTLTGPGLLDARHVWLRAALTELATPFEFVSMAVGGSRVADVDRQLDEAIEQRPDLVVVAVGANDALHGTPRRAFRKRFDRVVDRLADQVASVAVANIGDLGNIARVPYPLTSVLRWRAQVMCSIVESIVDDHETVDLLDVTASNHVFRDRSVFTADLFHPAEAGHAAWAEAALPGLRSAVARSQAT